MQLIDGFGSDLKVADIPWLRMNVDVILYQSIAREQLYISSFGSETTGPGVWSLIGENLTSADVTLFWHLVRFLYFATERFLWSSRSQKTFDRPFHWLSTGF